MSRRQQLASLMYRSGGLRLLNAYWGKSRITVLAYHRIIEWNNPEFPDYEPVVSATPMQFEQQMAYIAKNFNVIALSDLQQFLFNDGQLPTNPLLITFDDGYTDNYDFAFPILKRYGFPAVIFLVTSRMTEPTRLWWDQVAFAFHHTKRVEADVPALGRLTWSTIAEKRAVRETVIQHLKKIPENEKLATVEMLSRILEVQQSDERLFISWDQVRELVAQGVACQPHTVSHPIMTRIPKEEVYRQLSLAKTTIERETNQVANTFAYPNGTPADYSLETLSALRELGYTTAFTLTAGPMTAIDAQQNPLQIKRVYLGNRDSIELFAMKVMGVPALMDRTPYIK